MNDAFFVVDWDGDFSWDHPCSNLSSLVSEFRVQCALTANLTKAINVIEGVVGGQCTITLSGRHASGLTAAALLSPKQPRSPLAGAKRVGVYAKFAIRDGDDEVQQFIGRVRDITVSSAEGVATIVCSDWIEDMRGLVDLPVVGSATTHVFSPTWALDWLLRQMQLHASPATRSDAILSATLAGAWWPEKGWFDDEANGIHISLAPPWVAGKYSYAANADPTHRAYQDYHTDVAFCPRANTALALGFWVNWSSGIGDTQVSHSFASGVDTTRIVNISVGSSGTLQSVLTGPSYTTQLSTGPTITTAGWHYVGVHYKWGATGIPTVTFCLDGVNASPQTKPTYPLSITIPLRTQVRIDLQGQVNCVQVWTPPSGDIPSFPIHPVAVSTLLELAANQLRTLPDRHGVPAIDVVKEIVSADLGAIAADGTGLITFLRRSSLEASQEIIADEIGPSELDELELGDGLYQVRNVINGQVAPTTVFRDDSWGPNNVVFSAKDSALLRTGPNSTRVANVAFDDDGAAWVLEGSIPLITTAAWVKDGPTATQHGFVAADATTHAAVSGVSVSVKRVNYRALEVTVVNTSGSTIDLRLADSTFTPAFRVRGSRIHVYDRPQVIDSPAFDFAVDDSASVAAYGKRGYTLPDNDWRQNWADSQSLATSLLSDTALPTPVVTQPIVIGGNPRRKLGSTIVISDPDGVAESAAGVIVDLSRSGSGDDELQDTLTVKLIS